MTRAQARMQQQAARRSRALWVLAVVLFIGGAVAVSWLVIERDRLYGQLSHEADLRGDAVSTLAGDVRALRQQVKAEGKVPVAPDPTKAVEDLPSRAEVPVPVPIPGQSGPAGSPGPTGASGSPGASGVAGSPGAVGPTGPAGPAGPQGEQGVPGPAGQDGQDGADGRDGTDGQDCPDGYSLQAPSYDPDALVCRRDGAPDPGDSQSPSSLAAGLDPQRRVYT